MLRPGESPPEGLCGYGGMEVYGKDGCDKNPVRNVHLIEAFAGGLAGGKLNVSPR
jgi:hypothetical protein